MKTETYARPAVGNTVAAHRERERRDVGKLVATFLWQLLVIALGIVVGAVVALIAGLFLGWLSIAC